VVVLRFDAARSLDTKLPFWTAPQDIYRRKRTLVRGAL